MFCLHKTSTIFQNFRAVQIEIIKKKKKIQILLSTKKNLENRYIIYFFPNHQAHTFIHFPVFKKHSPC